MGGQKRLDKSRDKLIRAKTSLQDKNKLNRAHDDDDNKISAVHVEAEKTLNGNLIFGRSCFSCLRPRSLFLSLSLSLSLSFFISVRLCLSLSFYLCPSLSLFLSLSVSLSLSLSLSVSLSLSLSLYLCPSLSLSLSL